VRGERPRRPPRRLLLRVRPRPQRGAAAAHRESPGWCFSGVGVPLACPAALPSSSRSSGAGGDGERRGGGGGFVLLLALGLVASASASAFVWCRVVPFLFRCRGEPPCVRARSCARRVRRCPRLASPTYEDDPPLVLSL
jgi:hypothetical protein